VDPTRGIFKCFVCGEGGDVFAFVMKQSGMDFLSAVRYLAGRCGVEIPEEREERTDPHAHLRAATAFAEEWFSECLKGSCGESARAYLRARGLDEEQAERFALGYAPDAWRELRGAATAHGIEETVLLEVGLLATSERSEEPYDRFRGRLMFSIRDLRDRPIAFGGRLIRAQDGGAPKYINSPDSALFHKGKELYGLNWARHAIRREKAALLAEGFLDVIALHAGGFESAVAPLGTSLTREQAEMLARYGSRVFLLYDSDRAGLKATFRAADILLAAGVHPLVVTLPEGEDPDSFLRSGSLDLGRFLEDAVDVLERKLQILARRGMLESIEGRRRALDGLLSTLRAVRDPALRDIYLERTAEQTGIRRETLVSELARRMEGARLAPRRPPAAGRPAAPVASQEDDRFSRAAEDSRAERMLLLLLGRDPALGARALELGVRAEQFHGAPAAELFRTLTSEMVEPAAESAAEAVAGASDAARRLLLELNSDPTEVTHPGQALEESARRLVHRARLERLGLIDREMELADETQARELLIEKESIARELREAGVSLTFLRRVALESHGSMR